MRNLLRLIINNQFFLIFLLFEIISLLMVVRSNNYQQARYINMAQSINGFVSKKFNTLLEYLYLKDINAQLIEENLHLRNQIEKLIHDNPNYKILFRDTIYKQRYTYIPARVISNSVNKQYNFITIDMGAVDGIKPDMAVVSANGVVGKVESVTEHFSLVMSVLNRNMRISAKIKRNNYFGSFEWPGLNYRMGYLDEIPLHVDAKKGDTIITTGFSPIFPEGIKIGYISELSVKGGSFYNISITISNDFKNLNVVYIISDIRKLELQSIDKILK
jgi:rod shape-determining protein MreC